MIWHFQVIANNEQYKNDVSSPLFFPSYLATFVNLGGVKQSLLMVHTRPYVLWSTF